MLFKISVKNIRKSFKDYAVYFFTLILGVAVFYVFNAIDSQTVMLDVRKNVYDIIKLMNEMLSGVSVFVSCVLGFLIIYASRFLIKRRNKCFVGCFVNEKFNVFGFEKNVSCRHSVYKNQL